MSSPFDRMSQATTNPETDLPLNGRVLMIRLSALGDVIFALETVHALKAERPDVHLDFLVEDRFAAVLEDHPMIDELIVSPRKSKWRLLGHLLRMRREKYDVVLDLHGILKSGVQVLFVRARHKIGFAAPGSREGAAFAYHRRVELPDPLPHRAARGNYLLRALGLEAVTRPSVLGAGKDVPAFFPGWEGPKVILHPGTSAFAAFKRWPIERFIELARRLASEDVATGVSYGPGEEGLFAALRNAVPDVVEIDGRKLGLHGLAPALRQADVIVAADTGPLHIAIAVGAKVVALFGPKDSNLYGPRGEGHKLLFHDVPCRPCKLRTCASPQCVLGIEVDHVADTVMELLSP